MAQIPALSVHNISVSQDYIALRMRLEKLRNPAQGAWQQEVIGIQKSENLAGRSAKPLI